MPPGRPFALRSRCPKVNQLTSTKSAGWPLANVRNTSWTPVAALVLGIVLIAAGVVLLGRNSGGRHVSGQTEEMAPQPQADAP